MGNKSGYILLYADDGGQLIYRPKRQVPKKPKAIQKRSTSKSPARGQRTLKN